MTARSSNPDSADAPILLRGDIDGIALLSLNRPQQRNTLSEAMLTALAGEFASIAADKNVRAVILSHNGRLRIDLPDQAAHAPISVREAAKEASGAVLTDDEVRSFERSNIVAALKACGGKVFGRGGAAELLDMKPTTLASRIKALKIG